MPRIVVISNVLLLAFFSSCWTKVISKPETIIEKNKLKAEEIIDSINLRTKILNPPKVLYCFSVDSLNAIKDISSKIFYQLKELAYDFEEMTSSDSVKIFRRRNVGDEIRITSPAFFFLLEHNKDTLVVLTYFEEDVFQGNYALFFSSLFKLHKNNLFFIKNFYTMSEDINFIGYHPKYNELLFLSYDYTKDKVDVFSYNEIFRYRNEIDIPVIKEEPGCIIIKKL